MSTTDPSTYETPLADPRPAPAPSFAARTAASFRDRSKNPVLAAFLSLVPGLGQVYVGYYPRGFVNIIVTAGIISILASTRGYHAYLPLLGIFLVFFWLYNMIDAARLAALYNQAMAGGREPELPEGFQLPGMGGSIFGGAILIVAGFALLLHTRWGLRLDWLEEWWPAFPMLFGAYLLVKALRERGGSR
jgi:hypothetical protein